MDTDQQKTKTAGIIIMTEKERLICFSGELNKAEADAKEALSQIKMLKRMFKTLVKEKNI